MELDVMMILYMISYDFQIFQFHLFQKLPSFQFPLVLLCLLELLLGKTLWLDGERANGSSELHQVVGLVQLLEKTAHLNNLKTYLKQLIFNNLSLTMWDVPCSSHDPGN